MRLHLFMAALTLGWVEIPRAPNCRLVRSLHALAPVMMRHRTGG